MENIQTRYGDVQGMEMYGDVWSIMMMGSSLTHIGWKVPAAFSSLSTARWCILLYACRYICLHNPAHVFLRTCRKRDFCAASASA